MLHRLEEINQRLDQLTYDQYEHVDIVRSASESSSASLADLKSDVSTLWDAFRQELRDAIDGLTRHQSATAASQNDALRILSDAVVISGETSAGAFDDLRTVLGGFEQRFADSLQLQSASATMHPVDAEALNAGVESLRAEITGQAELLRKDIREITRRLTSMQSVAAASNNELLQTLTDAILSPPPAASSGSSLEPLTELLGEVEERLTAAIRQQQPETVRALPSGAAPPAATVDLQNQLVGLSESLTSEIREAVQCLTASQSAAATAQSEVLCALSQTIITTAASPARSDDRLEALFSGFEQRFSETLKRTLQAVLQAASEQRVGDLARGTPAPAATPHSAPASPPPQPPPRPAAEPQKSRSWQDIRNAFLRDSTHLGDGQTSDSGKDRAAHDRQSAAENRLSSDSESAPDADSDSDKSPAAAHPAKTVGAPEIPDLESLSIPEFVDIDTLPEQALREEAHRREELMSSLVARLRRRIQSSGDVLSREQLLLLADRLPQEMLNRVNHSLQRIDEQLRLGELELSIERARVARTAVQLESSRLQIERNARQMGWTVNPDGTLATTTAQATKGSASRRWLGKMGLNE